ncbi:MAG: RsmG family class I SAM-dependent methyltransferase [Planctomycetota bacterium]
MSPGPRRRGRRAPLPRTGGGTDAAGPAPARPAGLADLARQAELDVPAEAPKRLTAYLDAMLDENRRLNLSGIRDRDEALVLHALDALQVWAVVARSPRLVVDIGTGNGFPGVAAAALWPEARVVLVERTRKKAEAVGRCLAASGLAAEVLPLDASQVPALHPGLRHAADLVLSRATATLEAVARLAAPLLRPEGLCVQWKAAVVDPAERRAYEACLTRLRLLPREDLVYVLPTAEPRPRRLVTALRH